MPAVKTAISIDRRLYQEMDKMAKRLRVPRSRLFARLYRFYFRHLLPLIGQAISRSKDNAYRYLPASVQEFPDGAALAERLRRHGLRDVRWWPLTFGVAAVYVGWK